MIGGDVGDADGLFGLMRGKAGLFGNILAQLGIGDGTKFLVCALSLLRLDLLQQLAASADGAIASERYPRAEKPSKAGKKILRSAR